MLKKKENILLGIICLYFISFFIPFWNPSRVQAMALVMLYSFYLVPFSEKKLALQNRKHIWFMLAFSLVLILSVIFSHDKKAGMDVLRVRLPLVLFPISLGFLTITKELRDKILLALAIIVTIACAFTLSWAIHRYMQEQNTAWLYNDALSAGVGQQSIYTSMLVNIAIYILTYQLLSPKKFKLANAIFIACIIFLFFMSYMLASRNMMLILYSSVLFFSIYLLFQKRVIPGIIILSSFAIVIFVVLQFFPKTLNRFKEMAYTEFDYQGKGTEANYAGELTPDQWNGANFRIAAWRCGWEIFIEHPIAGVGVGDKKDALFAKYKEKDFQFALNTRKNVHNNYLDILFSMGTIGFVLFVTGWFVLPLVYLIRIKDLLGIVILMSFAIAMITEVYFDRSLGGVLFGFFVPFLLTFRPKIATQPN